MKRFLRRTEETKRKMSEVQRRRWEGTPPKDRKAFRTTMRRGTAATVLAGRAPPLRPAQEEK